jgi:exosortase A-associated hydrolase 1/exosortase A-associated hydrolase 2
MTSRQARALAASGYVVVVPDWCGTGDSQGGFGDADWETWRQDAGSLLDWVLEQGAGTIDFWGVRTGCLLALEMLSVHGDRLRDRVGRLVFWQPVLDGEKFITRFLRMKVAVAMMAGDKITVSDLREQVTRGDALEVAGYTLQPSLVEQLDQLKMQDLPVPANAQVLWLEVAGAGGKPLPPASGRLVDNWRGAGLRVDTGVIEGEPFWSTQEIAFAPSLIETTSELLGSPAPATGNPGEFEHVEPAIVPDGERPVTFSCHDSELVGVLHTVSEPVDRGVVLVVGGPQYRVGSHRQFVLLARFLAEQGIPVFRFDYRGIGDSEGPFAGFGGIHDDIANAIDCFQNQCPEVREVVIWGLCDAATAAAWYAGSDKRVAGLILLNPWVRSESGAAKAYLRHYYLQRLFSRAFWQKVFSRGIAIRRSLGGLGQNVRRALGREQSGHSPGEANAASESGPAAGRSLAESMYTGLTKFGGETLVILSGNDLTAAEFRDAVRASRKFRNLLAKKRFRTMSMDEADHTFSRRDWRDRVSQMTADWLRSW